MSSPFVYIVEEDCMGCGLCENLCPQVFKLDTVRGKAVVILPEGGPADLVQDVMDSCPAECIFWDE